MLKKITAVLLGIVLIASLCACAGQSDGTTDGKVSVSVSFDALAELTKAVGGDKVAVSTIIPAGTEPHDFEPTADSLVTLSSAAVFVYNGLGMESWAEEAVAVAENEDLVTVCATDGIDPIVNEDEEEIAEHGQYDPHAWLSLKCAETMAENIRDALTEVDPDNADFYEQNCSDYVAQLEGLFTQYADKFASAGKTSFVTGHAAFAYLCRDFGLEQNSVEDVFAEGEPTAQQLTELVKYCRDNDVTTIFAEELASSDVSRTLADEVGAKVVTIYTLESAEDELTYLERMEYNLSEIYKSLAD